MKKMNENKPKKIGYLKFKKLRDQILSQPDANCEPGIEKVRPADMLEFYEKYQPWGILYFFHRLPYYIADKINWYKITRLKLGKQKWKNGKLYIENIPYYIASEATDYLTAILRDYLRAYAKDAYAIGNVLFEREGGDGDCFPVRAVGSADGSKGYNDALEDWRKMVNDTADLFDEAADLRRAAWDAEKWEDMDRLWKEYRKKLVEAFDHLKVIFHELDD